MNNIENFLTIATDELLKDENIKVYENDKYSVIAPLSARAAFFYGKDTKWDIAYSYNYFNSIADYYTIFIFFDKHNGQKFLLTISKNNQEYMHLIDKDGNPVGLEYIKQNYDFFGPIMEGFGLLNFIPDIANGIISKKQRNYVESHVNKMALHYNMCLT